MNKYEMMLRVAADSPATFSLSSFQRYLEECQSAGYNLRSAKRYIESQKDLKPHVRNQLDPFFAEFMESLEEEL
jgi:hypothetical protein